MTFRFAVPIAAVAILAIGVTAAPARAQSSHDAFGSLIAGAVAGLVIGSIVSQKKADAHVVPKKAAPPSRHRPHYAPRRHHYGGPARWKGGSHRRWAAPHWRYGRGHHRPKFEHRPPEKGHAGPHRAPGHHSPPGHQRRH